MESPTWLQPALTGALAGAVVAMVVGFSWGGWMTGGSAEKMANKQAKAEVVTALAQICVYQSQNDPNAVQTLGQLQEANSYQRRDMLMKTGWATMPGATDPDRNVASKCMDTLAAQF